MTTIDKAQLEDRFRISRLLALYGELLPRNQRSVAALHFDEDLSLAEIAESRGTTRQAVHGAVRTALKNLERYDRVLKLIGSGALETPSAESPEAAPADDLRENARAILNDIRRRYLRGTILYDTRGLRARLDDLEALLDGKRATHSEEEALHV